MRKYYSRAELKFNAKKALRNRWTDGIALYLFPIALITIVQYLYFQSSLNFINQYPKFVDNIDYSFYANQTIPTIVMLIVTIMLMAANFRALDWYRSPQLQFKPIESTFARFRNPDWWKMLVLSLVTAFFTYLWTLLFIIPGIIKSMSYSQAYYIYKDLSDKGQDGGYTITDYITRSRKLMDGHKMDYFILQLSFIGWFLLGMITFGIGFIWIIPYYNLTMAGFYDDLAKNSKIV